jgi:hypothetical protein
VWGRVEVERIPTRQISIISRCASLQNLGFPGILFRVVCTPRICGKKGNWERLRSNKKNVLWRPWTTNKNLRRISEVFYYQQVSTSMTMKFILFSKTTSAEFSTEKLRMVHVVLLDAPKPIIQFCIFYSIFIFHGFPTFDIIGAIGSCLSDDRLLDCQMTDCLIQTSRQ